MPLTQVFLSVVHHASLDHLNPQLSASGFSLQKDPDNNFIFRVSYTGCFVQQRVCPTQSEVSIAYTLIWPLQMMVVIILWMDIDFSEWLSCADTKFGEEDKQIWRKTS